MIYPFLKAFFVPYTEVISHSLMTYPLKKLIFSKLMYGILAIENVVSKHLSKIWVECHSLLLVQTHTHSHTHTHTHRHIQRETHTDTYNNKASAPPNPTIPD